jgi:hypothetical protein
VRLVRWRRWGLALTVLATIGGLTVAGRGCYGLQIDGVGFSEVLVVEFG